MNGDAKPNQLIANLIDQVEVHNFQEKIPSFNDIFISIVENKPIEIVSLEYHTQSTE
jgi:ABC-type uncharacterized transport system ATPase subunit